MIKFYLVWLMMMQYCLYFYLIHFVYTHIISSSQKMHFFKALDLWDSYFTEGLFKQQTYIHTSTCNNDGLNICVLQNSYMKALNPNVMVFESEAFGRWFRVRWSDEGGVLTIRLVSLLRRGRSQRSLFLPCEGTVRKPLSANNDEVLL